MARHRRVRSWEGGRLGLSFQVVFSAFLAGHWSLFNADVFLVGIVLFWWGIAGFKHVSTMSFRAVTFCGGFRVV